MTKDGYPMEAELSGIRKWKIRTPQDAIDLVEYIETLWQYATCGYFVVFNKSDSIEVKMSTAGWSGNEDIIGALRDNMMFWVLYWQKSERGGHYTFSITLAPGEAR